MNQLIAYVSDFVPEFLTPYSFILILAVLLTVVSIVLTLLFLLIRSICRGISNARRRRKEKRRRMKAEKEARSRAASRRKELERQLKRYGDFQATEELPNDPAFIKQLMLDRERKGDFQRAFLCRKKLVREFGEIELYLPFAQDLIRGEYCKKDIRTAIAYLKGLRTKEAHYQLYQVYSNSTHKDYDISQAAIHLATAAQMGSTEAPDAVQELYKEAEQGNGKAAFLLSMYIGRMQTTLASDEERFHKNIEMLFWMLLAKDLEFPEAVAYYRELDANNQFPAQSEEALAIAKEALQEQDRPTYIVHTMLAVIYGNAEALRTLGRVLHLSKPPLHNEQLGDLCLCLAERKKASS